MFQQSVSWNSSIHAGRNSSSVTGVANAAQVRHLRKAYQLQLSTVVAVQLHDHT